MEKTVCLENLEFKFYLLFLPKNQKHPLLSGVFLLKMISMHAGNVMCARLTEQLWHRHSRLYRQKLLLTTVPTRKDSNASHQSRRRTPNRERRLSRTSSHGTNSQMVVDPAAIMPAIMSQSISDSRHYV